jgi:hypothetical protein
LIGENNSGSTPTSEELLADWAEVYGLTHPVVADSSFGVGGSFVEGGSIGLPSMTLLKPGAEIVIAGDYVTEADIASAIGE